MNNNIIIASREFKERFSSRSFLLMAIIGPLLVLSILYILFIASGAVKSEFKVLVSDPIELLGSKIKKDTNSHINYNFINQYIEPEDFADNVKYKSYDAVLVVNEKVLSNNHVFLYMREKLQPKVVFQIRREFERRLEELKVAEFTHLSLQQYWQIKHPVSMEVRDAFHPSELGNYKLAAYAGYAFGIVIFVFIFLFGMTVLRSTNREKSSRIAEVLLATVKPSELMFGKIIGIGLAALLQFLIWATIIGLGLLSIRYFVYPDLFDVSNMNLVNMTSSSNAFEYNSYNEIVQLVFEQINFTVMLSLFIFLLILGYLFFAGLFAALGAAQGSESDGQQFLIPLMCLFFIGIWAGYFVAENPDSTLAFWLQMIPITSPITVMVKFAQGYGPGEAWHLIASIIILVLGIFVNIYFAGKLFKRGLLSYGYRLKFAQFFKWLK